MNQQRGVTVWFTGLSGSGKTTIANAPLAICELRDVKGLYQKARAGSIDNFTGISSAYEVPLAPDLECQTDRETVAQSTSKVLKKLEELDYIRPILKPCSTELSTTVINT